MKKPLNRNLKVRSRTEYSVLNIVAGLGGYALSIILSLINRMVFTRCMPPAYLGISGLFTNILSMLSLAELGISGAIVYALYKPLAENDEEIIAAIVSLFGKAYRAIGLVIAGAGLCVLPFLTILVGEQTDIAESIHIIYLFYLFNTAVSYLFTYRSTLLVAAQKNYIVTGLNYLVLSVQEIVQAIFLLWKRDYVGYLIIQTVFSIGYYVWISHIAIKQYPYIRTKNIKRLPDEERKRIFSDVKDLMVYKISGVLVNSTDNILIVFFNGLATTGFASNYTLLVNTLNSLLGQVFNGITASVGNHNASESREKQFQMFNFLHMMNFWLFGWGALGIIFCSSDLVQLCFGGEYVLPIEIPLVMALNFFTVGMMNAVWTYKHTLGLFHYGRFIQFFTGVLNVVFSVLCGTKWGLFGILFATFIARAMTSLWYDPYAVFKYGFDKPLVLYVKKIIRYMIILLIAAVACKLSFTLISGPLVLQIILKILLCSVVTNVVFMIALGRTYEYRMLKKYVMSVAEKLSRRCRAATR